MTYQYDHNHYNPPAPVVRVTVRIPSDNTGQVTTNALVDTGADVTCVPEALVMAVGGEPAGTRDVGSINQVHIGSFNAYFLEFEIASTRKLVEVIAIGDQVILGRNLINEFVLQLDGPARKLSIT